MLFDNTENKKIMEVKNELILANSSTLFDEILLVFSSRKIEKCWDFGFKFFSRKLSVGQDAFRTFFFFSEKP